MERVICLDGTPICLTVDRIEIDFHRGNGKALAPERHCQEQCHCDGVTWQPVLGYEDGTVVYFHCPPEGARGPLGYRVEGPQPHRWQIILVEYGRERVAKLSWELT